MGRRGKGSCAVALAAAFLAGCTTLPVAPKIVPSLVIADEPVAAKAVAGLVSSGEANAADGAVALALALSVTFPAAAGLGAEGVCLHERAATGTITSIDFRAPPGGAVASIAPPRLLAGLSVLHGNFGKAPWPALVTPATRLAREGFGASSAFVRRIIGDAARSAVPEAYVKLFGGVLTEDRMVRQPDLAATLSTIAIEGPAALTGGSMTARVALAMAGADRDLDVEKAASVIASIRAVASRADASVLANGAVLWQPVAAGQGPLSGIFAASGEEGPMRLEAFAAEQARFDDLGATSFLVADAAGDKVLCALTMNGPFGARVMADDLGFAFALTENVAGAGTRLLAPLMLRGDGIALDLAGAGQIAAITAGRLVIDSLAASGPSGLAERLPDLMIGPVDALVLLACAKPFPDSSCRFTATPGGFGTSIASGSRTGSAYALKRLAAPLPPPPTRRF